MVATEVALTDMAGTDVARTGRRSSYAIWPFANIRAKKTLEAPMGVWRIPEFKLHSARENTADLPT